MAATAPRRLAAAWLRCLLAVVALSSAVARSGAAANAERPVTLMRHHRHAHARRAQQDPASDVESQIATNFAEIDRRITELNDQVVAVQTDINDLEAKATATSARVAESRALLVEAEQKAQDNTLLAETLKAEAAAAEQRIQEVTADIGSLGELVKELDTTSSQLDTTAKTAREEVDDLQTRLDTVLPGHDTFQLRLQKATDTVAAYNQEVATPAFAAGIEQSLRTHFRRATDHVIALTSETAAAAEAAASQTDG